MSEPLRSFLRLVEPEADALPAASPSPDKETTVTLTECVRLALRGNFNLQNSARNLLAAQSEYRAAWAEFIPSLSIDASHSLAHDKEGYKQLGTLEKTETADTQADLTVTQRLPTGAEFKGVYGGGRERVHTRASHSKDEETGLMTGPGTNVVEKEYDAAFDLSLTQPLLRGGGLERGTADLRRSRISKLREEIGDYISRRDTTLRVIRAYYEILKAELDIQVSEEALKEKRAFLEEAKVRHALGLIAQSEILRAEIQLLQEDTRAIDRQTALKRRKDALVQLLGAPLETPLVVSPTALIDQAEAAEIPPLEIGVAEALALRAEMADNRLKLRSAEIDLAVRRNDVLPELDVTGEYSDDKQGEDWDVYGDLGEEHEKRVTVDLSVPLPNIERREARKRAELSLENARTDFDRTVNDIVSDAREAYRNVLSQERQLRVLRQLARQARESLNLERERFNFGLNTAKDVRDAQDDLFEAETQYNRALLDYQVQIASLYLAIGRPLY